jgi:hypothetical protein
MKRVLLSTAQRETRQSPVPRQRPARIDDSSARTPEVRVATATAQFVVLGDRDVISRIHRNKEPVAGGSAVPCVGLSTPACLLSHC